MKAIASTLVLSFTLASNAFAQSPEPPAAPPPPPPVTTAPSGLPPQPFPPPAQPPPQGMAAPQGWAPVAPQPTEVVMMPPGYLEQPGRFPRNVPVEDIRVPPPVGYRVEKEPRKPLWLAGTIIFSVSHAITGLTGGGLYSSGDREYEDAWLLMVPVIGPVIWSPLAYGIESDEARATFAGMSLITAVQATGLGLMIGGFALRRPVYRRNDVAQVDDQTSVTLIPSTNGATLQIDF